MKAFLDRSVGSAGLGLGLIALAIAMSCACLFGGAALPALQAARRLPGPALRSGETGGVGGGIAGGIAGGARVRTALVVAQFAVAVTLSAITLITFAQVRYAHRFDHGVATDHLLVLNSMNSDGVVQQQNSLKAALANIPGIVSVARSSQVPFDDVYNGFAFQLDGAEGGEPVNLNWMQADPAFYESYDIVPIAGRLPRADLDADRRILPGTAPSAPQKGVAVLSREAVRRLGLPSPEAAVGRHLVSGVTGNQDTIFTVVGVVDDLHLKSIKDVPRPWIFFASGAPAQSFSLKLAPGVEGPVL